MSKSETHQVARQILERRETEHNLARLAAMPDLLERYDELRERMTRMLVFIEFISSENRNHWDKVPKRVDDAFRLLSKDARSTQKEIEAREGTQHVT